MSCVRLGLRSRLGLRTGVLVFAAMVGGLSASAPTTAFAQNTLSLSVEPSIPGKGRAFQLIAQGAAKDYFVIDAVISPGDAGCASTPALEKALPERVGAGGSADDEGPFDIRWVSSSFNLASWRAGGQSNEDGAKVGRYHVCGYLGESDEEKVPAATTRLDFTVGGTCASSTARVAKADKALRKANTARRRAKRAYKRSRSARNAKRVKSAEAKVKTAKRSLKTARSDRKALC